MGIIRAPDLLLLEIERRGIHAITQSGRFRTIRKNVSAMSSCNGCTTSTGIQTDQWNGHLLAEKLGDVSDHELMSEKAVSQATGIKLRTLRDGDVSVATPTPLPACSFPPRGLLGDQKNFPIVSRGRNLHIDFFLEGRTPRLCSDACSPFNWLESTSTAGTIREHRRGENSPNHPNQS